MLKHSRSYLCSEGKYKQLRMQHIMPFVLLSLPSLPLQTLEKTLINVFKAESDPL